MVTLTPTIIVSPGSVMYGVGSSIGPKYIGSHVAWWSIFNTSAHAHAHDKYVSPFFFSTCSLTLIVKRLLMSSPRTEVCEPRSATPLLVRTRLSASLDTA